MRGRKPAVDNVVPMTADVPIGNFDAFARDRAAELKPTGLSARSSTVWNRLAPAVCHPTVGRLKPHTVQAFVLLCDAVARYEQLVSWLKRNKETYTAKTRNGLQHKMRPEVGQRNEAFRQALTMLRDFGLTPAAERGMTAGGQQGKFDFGEDDFT
jgi:P27 family predicted phage terminase small subunit